MKKKDASLKYLFFPFLSTMLIMIVLCAGCSTRVTGVKSSYSPNSPPIYTESFHGSLTVSRIRIIDKRDMEPTAYYKSFYTSNEANYDRNVSDIVGEALKTELDRAGVGAQKSANTSATTNGTTVRAQVLEYLAHVSRPTGFFLVSDVLDLKVSIRFRWIDEDGKLLEENIRSEHVTRKLGVSNAPIMPTGSEQIEDYGKELMNSVLPRVIEKEIRLNKVLK